MPYLISSQVMIKTIVTKGNEIARVVPSLTQFPIQ